MKAPYTLLLALCLFLSASQMTGQNSRSDGASICPSEQLLDKLANRQPTNRLVVQLQPGASPADFAKQASAACRFAKQIYHEKPLAPQHGVHLFSASQILDREAVVTSLRQMPGVVSASWNSAVTFRDTLPNDTLYPTQWSHERIGLPRVWGVTTGGLSASGREIVVAVLDKGFDIQHPDLAGNIWHNPGEVPADGEDNDGNGYVDDVTGWNFRLGQPDNEVLPHGTSVSGIVGAKGNNIGAIAGINWDVKLMCLGIDSVHEVIEGFQYVLDMRTRYNETGGQAGAFVVATNGSFGIDGTPCSVDPAWGALYDPLGEAGVLSAAATANEGWDVDVVGDIPTSCPSEFLIAVTNTDENDKRNGGAAWGATSIDLGAPGTGIPTISSIGDGINPGFGGTSAACPHVAGAIGLLYSLPCPALDSLALADPPACARLVRDAILLNTAQELSLKDETVSGGILNVHEAMDYLHAWCISRPGEREAGDFKNIYLGKKAFARVYPNPVRDLLKVDYSHLNFNDMRVRAYNMLGQEVLAPVIVSPSYFEAQHFELDVSNWAAGAYVLNIFDLGRKISFTILKH